MITDCLLSLVKKQTNMWVNFALLEKKHFKIRLSSFFLNNTMIFKRKIMFSWNFRIRRVWFFSENQEFSGSYLTEKLRPRWMKFIAHGHRVNDRHWTRLQVSGLMAWAFHRTKHFPSIIWKSWPISETCSNGKIEQVIPEHFSWKICIEMIYSEENSEPIILLWVLVNRC